MSCYIKIEEKEMEVKISGGNGIEEFLWRYEEVFFCMSVEFALIKSEFFGLNLQAEKYQIFLKL